MAGAALLVYRFFRDLRGLLLWRVRRKLTLSYIFIGFVPALLIIVLSLASGLLLFFMVSQYLASAAVEARAEQARMLAESATVGLQGATTDAERLARLERRQAGVEKTLPFVSFALVPVRGGCDGSTETAAVPAAAAAGPWRHLDPPTRIPDRLRCMATAGLIAYDTASLDSPDRNGARASIAARAVAWPDDPAPRFAVVVDLPFSAALGDQVRRDTGIQIGDASPVVRENECTARPVRGRTIEAPGAAAAGTREATATRNPLKRPFEWVTFLQYTDWDSGAVGCVSMAIGMTMADIYNRISATPVSAGDGRDLSDTLLTIVGILGVLFLVIQFAALVMGLALARSITGSVHEISVGTERVRLGDFTHKIPIRSRDQLGELAESFNSMTSSIEDLLQEKAEKERMEQELRIARNIQMSLLPQGGITVPGLSLTAHCEPAREVGGDYYDTFPIDDHRVGLLIADVAGKGTSAALYMAELKGLMLSLSQLHTSPRKLLIDANRIISRHLDSRSFITITYAVVDTEARTLTYARAGHCPLIYVPGPDAPSRAAQILAPDGLVLGLQIDDGQRFNALLEESTLPLGPGDLFLFYTDGLTEAMDAVGECFGDARLAALMQEHADLPFEELRERILREIGIFSGPAVQQDDMTMLLLKVEGVASPVVYASRRAGAAEAGL